MIFKNFTKSFKDYKVEGKYLHRKCDCILGKLNNKLKIVL